MKFLWLASVAVFITFFYACTKERFSTDSSLLLRTSVDTLHFDTVFTSTGSVTQFIKIINDNNVGVKVNSITLAGGQASAFRINADGVPGPQVQQIEIAARDSAYVFVTVTIDPTAADLPFIVQDSIFINYNGNTKTVQLDAFGQNANFLRNKLVIGDETWNAGLPYVILGQLLVRPNATLHITAGAKIFVHADAPVIVQGTLKVEGTKDERVVFTGDRLDEPYRNFPASYPGLIFTELSQNNVLNYTTIKNAYQGIVTVGRPPVGAKLTLNETIIDNAYEHGIWAVNSSITANNLLVSNCGQNVLLFGGGDYHFTHTTIAAYSTAYIAHTKRALTVQDYYIQNDVTYAFPLNAVFTNTIIWGEKNGFVDDEVLVEKKGNQTPTITFNKVLWRIKTAPSPAVATVLGVPINSDPQFDSINTSRRIFDFRVQKKNSPAVDAGVATPLRIDLDGLPRPRGNAPDLGAYEKQ